MCRRKRNRRRRLAERQAWRCAWCGGVMDDGGGGPDCATLEHVIPRHAGGGDTDANLVAACSACNKARAESSSVQSFLRLRGRLVRNGRWPPCAAPSQRVRQLLVSFRKSRAQGDAEPRPGSIASKIPVSAGGGAPAGSQDVPATSLHHDAVRAEAEACRCL